MKGTILIVTSFRDGVLQYASIRDNVFTEYIQEMVHLDMDLLQLIEKIYAESPPEGILVDRSTIRGFASIRLLLTTLNFIAWTRDIPIAAIDDYSMVRKNPSFVDDVRDRIHASPHFAGQLLPDYAAPADITNTKRSRKFTIS